MSLDGTGHDGDYKESPTERGERHTRNELLLPPRLKASSEGDRHTVEREDDSPVLRGSLGTLALARGTKTSREGELLSVGGADQEMPTRLSLVAVR